MLDTLHWKYLYFFRVCIYLFWTMILLLSFLHTGSSRRTWFSGTSRRYRTGWSSWTNGTSWPTWTSWTSWIKLSCWICKSFVAFGWVDKKWLNFSFLICHKIFVGVWRMTWKALVEVSSTDFLVSEDQKEDRSVLCIEEILQVLSHMTKFQISNSSYLLQFFSCCF